MQPIKNDIPLQSSLPSRPLLPHLQELMERELGMTDKKTQEVFVPVIGGKWKVRK